MGKQLQEDTHEPSAFLEKVLDGMAYYAVQHTYEWPCAHGLELFHLHLSAVTKEVCIQAAPWYSFKNGSRKNGCTWRYFLKSPDEEDHVVIVTCHMVVTRDNWTLTTSIHEDEASTNGYVFIGDLDPWTRAVEWTFKLHELIGAFDLGDLVARFFFFRRLHGNCFSELSLLYGKPLKTCST